jgi:hypothetical protein
MFIPTPALFIGAATIDHYSQSKEDQIQSNEDLEYGLKLAATVIALPIIGPALLAEAFLFPSKPTVSDYDANEIEWLTRQMNANDDQEFKDYYQEEINKILAQYE